MTTLIGNPTHQAALRAKVSAQPALRGTPGARSALLGTLVQRSALLGSANFRPAQRGHLIVPPRIYIGEDVLIEIRNLRDTVTGTVINSTVALAQLRDSAGSLIGTFGLDAPGSNGNHRITIDDTTPLSGIDIVTLSIVIRVSGGGATARFRTRGIPVGYRDEAF